MIILSASRIFFGAISALTEIQSIITFQSPSNVESANTMHYFFVFVSFTACLRFFLQTGVWNIYCLCLTTLTCKRLFVHCSLSVTEQWAKNLLLSQSRHVLTVRVLISWNWWTLLIKFIINLLMIILTCVISETLGTLVVYFLPREADMLARSWGF